jgi:hypothetical protein
MLDRSSSGQAVAWRAMEFDSSLCTWLVLAPLNCLPRPFLLYITLTWVSCGLRCVSLPDSRDLQWNACYCCCSTGSDHFEGLGSSTCRTVVTWMYDCSRSSAIDGRAASALAARPRLLKNQSHHVRCFVDLPVRCFVDLPLHHTQRCHVIRLYIRAAYRLHQTSSSRTVPAPVPAQVPVPAGQPARRSWQVYVNTASTAT